MLKRKRNQKTDYHKRFELLKSDKPRAVIRKTQKRINVQIVSYSKDGDNTLLEINSKKLRDFGWKASLKNLPAAYLTGLLTGLKAQEKGIKAMVPDLGLQPKTKGNKLFVVIKGIKDSGVHINISDEVLPDESRIKAEHITNIPQKNNQFAAYKIKLQNITKHFKAVKDKIQGD